MIAFDPQGDSLAVAEDSSATRNAGDSRRGYRAGAQLDLALAAAGQGFANFGIVIYAPDGRSLIVPSLH